MSEFAEIDRLCQEVARWEVRCADRDDRIAALEAQLAEANGRLIAAGVICEQTQKIEAARQELKTEVRTLRAELEEARNLTCEDCGGDGWVEPESGDPILDKPYPCECSTGRGIRIAALEAKLKESQAVEKAMRERMERAFAVNVKQRMDLDDLRARVERLRDLLREIRDGGWVVRSGMAMVIERTLNQQEGEVEHADDCFAGLGGECSCGGGGGNDAIRADLADIDQQEPTNPPTTEPDRT